MFDPELNPYVAEIEKYRDIIITDQYDSDEIRKKAISIDREKRVVLDLGCGAGNFLRDYARIEPDVAFFGFELRYKRLVKGAIKFRKYHIENVSLIQARAESINRWFHPESVNEIYINFPDPWPKKRHRKHRLLNQGFLEVMAELLVEDGFWSLKTDHGEYFAPAVELVEKSQMFEVAEYSEDLHRSSFNETNILTEFESLFKNKGYPVYYLKCELRKSS